MIKSAEIQRPYPLGHGAAIADIKMQSEYVAFPCKEYIFMQAKVPAPGQSLMRYIAERDVTLLIGWVTHQIYI